MINIFKHIDVAKNKAVAFMLVLASMFGACKRDCGCDRNGGKTVEVYTVYTVSTVSSGSKPTQQSAKNPQQKAPQSTKDTACVLGLTKYGKNGPRTEIKFTRKNGEVINMEKSFSDSHNNTIICDKNKQMDFMERGDVIVVNHVQGNKDHDAYWEIVENVTINRMKNEWLKEHKNTNANPAKDTAYVLGVVKYGKNGPRTKIKFVKKSGEVGTIEDAFSDSHNNTIICDKNKQMDFMERGDEFIVNRVQANKDHDAYWEVLENLATTRIKKSWLEQKAK